MEDRLVTESTAPGSELLIRAQDYLCRRGQRLDPGTRLEGDWAAFHAFCSRKIRSFATSCGAGGSDLDDCVQEVWRELLVRLPAFRLDSHRGRFETWLFQIVRSKAVNLCRSKRDCPSHEPPNAIQEIADACPSPDVAIEDAEVMRLVWDRLRQKLSFCTYQVLHLRLVQSLSVAEVAANLGLGSKQVWYRYHRALGHLQQIGREYAGSSG